jgi:hypothetical protein
MPAKHRTFWVVRQRYQRAGYFGSLTAVALMALYLVPKVHGGERSLVIEDPAALLATLATLAAAALIPLILARIGWLIHRRRFVEDLYRLGGS